MVLSPPNARSMSRAKVSPAINDDGVTGKEVGVGVCEYGCMYEPGRQGRVCVLAR